jgi:heme-degrading monooxygenase HmoA
MHARVSTFQGSPDQMDEASQMVREQVLPEARQREGFKGVISLLDRSSGKSIAVTLWESEDAMRASEGWADQAREQSAAAGGGQISGVERYEVDILEVEG